MGREGSQLESSFNRICLEYACEELSVLMTDVGVPIPLWMVLSPSFGVVRKLSTNQRERQDAAFFSGFCFRFLLDLVPA